MELAGKRGCDLTPLNAGCHLLHGMRPYLAPRRLILDEVLQWGPDQKLSQAGQVDVRSSSPRAPFPTPTSRSSSWSPWFVPPSYSAGA